MNLCPTCRHNRRAGRCSNRRCPEYTPADPETVRAALIEMRTAITTARESE